MEIQPVLETSQLCISRLETSVFHPLGTRGSAASLAMANEQRTGHPFSVSPDGQGWGTQMAGINQTRSKLSVCAPRPAARNCTLFLSSTGFGKGRCGWMAPMHKTSRYNGHLLTWRWQRCICYQAANKTAMQSTATATLLRNSTDRYSLSRARW